MPQSTVTIVDPYSSGAMLARALGGRGVRCVAVQSAPAMPADMKRHFDPGSFAAVIDHHGDVADTSRALEAYRPSHVVAGFESGVELADRLADRLGLPGNAAATSEVRRNKSLMAEAAGRHGLRVPRQTCSSRVEDLVAWSRELDTWPVIVKPVRSVASDMVTRCPDEAAVRRAAARVLSHPTVLGEANYAVLVQEYLAGTEYAVDTVSVDGEAKVTAYWEYLRPRPPASAGRAAYNGMRLLPYAGERQAALRASALQVLEALGIVFGPAHIEIMWIEDQPVLIEAGARLSAGVNAELSGLCGGISQLDETVAAILEPQAFRSTLSHRPALRREAANVFLIPPRPGRLKRAPDVAAIASLPTVHSWSLQSAPGERLRPVAGRVTLMAEDPGAIERDVARIRELERALFDVDESDSP